MSKRYQYPHQSASIVEAWLNESPLHLAIELGLRVVYLSYTYLDLRITEIQNPYKFDECVHCCGTMNSPQHPGLPPCGVGDLQPLVLTVPLFLSCQTFFILEIRYLQQSLDCLRFLF